MATGTRLLDETKTCSVCEVERPLDHFSRNSASKDGRHPQCKPCKWERCDKSKHNARNRSHYQQNKDYYAEKARRYYEENKEKKRRYNRDWRLWNEYRISPEEYERMLEHQSGVCAICGGKEPIIDFRTDEQRRLSVDHDHETGEVRGLLCSECNKGLGNFGDDPEMLHAAADYLTRGDDL